MKTGLILEGGAMRGLFTAGIMDVLMEHHVEFDGAIGVSAGAAFGVNYKSEQPGRVIRYNKRFAKDPRYCSFRSLVTSGNLYNADFCYHVVPTKYDVFDFETFQKNPMEFWVVTTDSETVEPVYHKLEHGDETDLEWLRASASMPIASTEVELDGHKYLDGGIADSVPLAFFESQGYEKNVVILTQPKGYVKPPQRGLGFTKAYLHNNPAMYARLENRHNEYNEQLAYIKKREEEGAILAIYPEEPLDIGVISHDPKDMQRIYDIGRATGEKYLAKVQEYLAS